MSRSSSRRWLPWFGLLALVGAVGLVVIGLAGRGSSADPTPDPFPPVRPTATAEPLIPTRTPEGEDLSETPTLEGTLVEGIEAVPVGAEAFWQGRPRWGVGVAWGSIDEYDVASLQLGWYVDWRVQVDPPRPGGIEYVQMVRMSEDRLVVEAETIAAAAQANPGSLWLVGNEPDSFMQDNVEPGVYARLYHEAYTAIKAADATAQVAIGGVIQPTPLRLRYLEAILAAYEAQFGVEMPVDVWNVHNFILREEEGTWGAFIPPGLPDQQGMLYEIDDCGNLEIFRQQIVGFRRWMMERGYQEKPLIISEYGIPMPEDYGFPPERMVAFLTATFDYFLTAKDPELGYPADDYRLVQRWCWYSLNAPDSYYPAGRLFDPQTKRLTAVGEGWAAYVNDVEHEP